MIHKIKALYDDGQGLSIRAIGQKLGLSCNTVRKFLRQDKAVIKAVQTFLQCSKKLNVHCDYVAYLLGAIRA